MTIEDVKFALYYISGNDEVEYMTIKIKDKK